MAFFGPKQMKQDTFWETKKVRPRSYLLSSKSHTYFLFAILSVCSTLSLSKLFKSYLKKPCGLPSPQHALCRTGRLGCEHSSLGNPSRTWHGTESHVGLGARPRPNFGLSVRFFLPPERL